MDEFFKKTAMSMNGFASFCEQFGDDVYAQELLDIVLDIIINEEQVALNGEEETSEEQNE